MSQHHLCELQRWAWTTERAASSRQSLPLPSREHVWAAGRGQSLHPLFWGLRLLLEDPQTGADCCPGVVGVSVGCQTFVIVVQSPCHVWFFATPWTATRQPSLSFTISQNLLKSMSIESLMPSNHLILCHPLLLLPSVFPCVKIFPMIGYLLQVAKVLPHPTWRV